MTTSTGARFGQRAVTELVAVLTELGVDARVAAADGYDLVVGGQPVEVKAASRPTLGQLRRLGVGNPTSEVARVVVVDQLDSQARMTLQEAGWGWLDRATGHLRVMAPSVQIDRDVPGLSGPDTSLPDPLARPTGLAVALELLLSDEQRSLRHLATAAGVSLASAHVAVNGLEELGLLVDGRRSGPRLFWAVAERWRVRWFPLARGPLPGIPESVRNLLRMGFEDRTGEGWAEVGDTAAQAFGARVAAESVPRLYVPDQRALTWAIRTWGEAVDEQAATSHLAVPPTPHAVRRRVEGGGEWPLASPIVVALELASDGSSRSREILEDWTKLPPGLQRVW